MATSRDYLDFAGDLYDEARELFEEANQEYSSDASFTQNFDFVAEAMQIGGREDFMPRDAALTYAMKSVFSILKNHSTRQSMRSRYLDLINYLTIAAWMDEQAEYTETNPIVEPETSVIFTPTLDRDLGGYWVCGACLRRHPKTRQTCSCGHKLGTSFVKVPGFE